MSYDRFDKEKEGLEKINLLLGLIDPHGQVLNHLSAIDQLAIITKIRQELSNESCLTDDEMNNLIQNSTLMPIILQILSVPHSPDVKYMQLEAGWILTNLAFGSSDTLKLIFTPDFTRVINLLLASCDIVMLDQLMFLFGNITGTDKELRRMVRSFFDLPGVIIAVLENNKEVPKPFAKNYVWVANNLSQDYKYLSLKDFRALSTIFYEFIEYYKQNNQDELLDCVKGLCNLSATNDPQAIKWVSGINF